MVRGRVDDLIRELEGLRLQQARSRIRQQEILSELTENVIQEAEEISPTFTVGDRVRITTTRNSRPHGGAATERDYTATVTRVTDSRIYVRTDNGCHTWRARTNVTLLPLARF